MSESERPTPYSWRAFFGKRCLACQREKKSRMAFCRECYHRLPPRIQEKLWKHFRSGFEQAFDEALHYLKG